MYDGQHLHTFEPGSLVHLDGEPDGRDYTVVSHDYRATTLRQELPTGFAIRSLSCWRRASLADPRITRSTDGTVRVRTSQPD